MLIWIHEVEQRRDFVPEVLQDCLLRTLKRRSNVLVLDAWRNFTVDVLKQRDRLSQFVEH